MDAGFGDVVFCMGFEPNWDSARSRISVRFTRGPRSGMSP